MKKNMVRIDERFHRNLSLFLEKEIPSDSSFVLAVSGGIDSMVLLDLFSGFVTEKGVNACVAHMNHGIRAESDEEYEFVEAASKKNGLRFYGCKKDIPFLLENSYKGRSPEECARDVRRSFLESVKNEFHGDYIVTAHHKDDLLETFIMRLIKGTGMNGITGMRKTDGHILRPLMDFWRKDIENYAFLKKIEYREDKTNYDVDYLRNLIRIRTVPHLRESFGDSVKDVLIRDWDNLSAADEFIDYYYLEDFKKKCEIKPDECHVFFCDVVKYPAAVRREYLLRLYRDWNGSVFGMDGKKVVSICERMEKPGNFTIDIDKNSVFEKSYEDVYFRRRAVEFVSRPEETDDLIKIYDSVDSVLKSPVFVIREYDRGNVKKLSATIFEQVCDGLKENDNDDVACFDLDELDFPIYIRNVKEGDRFVPLGMNGSKKISKFFKDSHVPRETRKRVMVLLNSKHDIIWCVGLRIADGFKVKEDTKRVMRIEIEKKL